MVAAVKAFFFFIDWYCDEDRVPLFVEIDYERYLTSGTASHCLLSLSPHRHIMCNNGSKEEGPGVLVGEGDWYFEVPVIIEELKRTGVFSKWQKQCDA